MRPSHWSRIVVLLAGLAACGAEGEETPATHGGPMPPGPDLPEETATPQGIHVVPDSAERPAPPSPPP